MGNKNRGPRKPVPREKLPTQLIDIGRHIVYAEGTRTEPEYVKSIEKEIRKKHRFRNERISIIEIGKKASGLDTLRLVEFAEKDLAERRNSGEQYDYVWLFFDLDKFPYNDYLAAIKKIEDKNNDSFSEHHYLNEPCDKYGSRWVSCHSARCFELWGCLYFSYYQAVTDNCDDYIDNINKQLKNAGVSEKYGKNREDLHQLLISGGGSLSNAIKYAEKLNKENGNNNPSTHIDSFGRYFEKYLEKGADE